MAAHFRHRPVILRFIEYMDVGSTNGWRAKQVVTGAEILAAIAARWRLEPLPPSRAGEVASRYRYADGGGEIGVIQSVSRPFCAGCTRARLSADGKLFTCLFARRGTDLRGRLRAGASEQELEQLLRDVWTGRADRYSAERANLGGRLSQARRGARERGLAPRVEMSYIGG
jgi:cyclic pyranopterin phosphate synthase